METGWNPLAFTVATPVGTTDGGGRVGTNVGGRIVGVRVL